MRCGNFYRKEREFTRKFDGHGIKNEYSVTFGMGTGTEIATWEWEAMGITNPFLQT